MDGKAVRGAIQPDRRAVHLLAAMPQRFPAVLAQRDVAHRTNEITQVKPLLDPLDLTGWAVTLDALHGQRETARYLVEDKGAAYVFTAIKDNQPTLFAQLDALPWTTVPIGHTMHDRGHRRQEMRTIQVLPGPPKGSFPTPNRRSWSNGMPMTSTVPSPQRSPHWASPPYPLPKPDPNASRT
ncbi:MAG: ISAs1 family transposase [Actinomycetota bacterium]|nr:ISAs1 family transposase [Actinomycetota bacterium]